jgi:hypothetical protein
MRAQVPHGEGTIRCRDDAVDPDAPVKYEFTGQWALGMPTDGEARAVSVDGAQSVFLRYKKRNIISASVAPLNADAVVRNPVDVPEALGMITRPPNPNVYAIPPSAIPPGMIQIKDSSSPFFGAIYDGETKGGRPHGKGRVIGYLPEHVGHFYAGNWVNGRW